MKKILFRNSLVGAIAILSLSVIVAAPIANAQNTRMLEEARNIREKTNESAEQKREAAQEAFGEKRNAAQTRLSDTKREVCEKHQTKITNTMARISDRGQKHITLFTTITERVQAFYETKGYTLETYDSLVTKVTEAKATAQTAVETTKTTGAEFKCDGDDPKGVAETFRANLKAQGAAMKEYRTAVKNLIVGVKSVQPEAESTREDQ